MMDARSHTPKRGGRTGRQPARYEHDLCSFAVEQAALLRAVRLDQADARNIAEELDDLRSGQYEKLESALHSSVSSQVGSSTAAVDARLADHHPGAAQSRPAPAEEEPRPQVPHGRSAERALSRCQHRGYRAVEARRAQIHRELTRLVAEVHH